MVCSLIDHRNDIKMFKTLQYFDVISMVDKRTDHRKLLSYYC